MQKTSRLGPGHCVHFFLLRREFLSIFRSLYDFKHACYDVRARLWTSAAKEASWAAAMLHVTFSDLKRPWDEKISVSDASLSGYAVRMLDSQSQQVGTIGRQREMWRYKCSEPATQARYKALKLDPFKDHESVTYRQGMLRPFHFERRVPFCS